MNLFYAILTVQLSNFATCFEFGSVWNNLKHTASCKVLGTCCNEYYIPQDFDGLRYSLKTRVYGQPLVEEAVDALVAHWSHEPKKALTLSFHGWPGGGKNYVSSFIADHLYYKGSKSQFVHHFNGRLHFPREDMILNYKEDLREWLKGNVTKCEKQLFIFDEVDKMPSQVLNIIKPMIDYKEVVDGVDFRHSIFIFLSNTGETVINQKYVELWKSGKIREEIKLSDFESIIMKGAFNEKGGFHQSDVIKSNLIDSYIPFLPLEKPHVKLCILDEFRLRNVTNPETHHVDEIMEFIEWGPSNLELFSKTGCKRVSQKVGIAVSKHYDKTGKCKSCKDEL